MAAHVTLAAPGAPALSAWCVRAQAMLYSRDALAGPRVRSVQAQARGLCPWRMCQSPPRALWWESSLRSAGALSHEGCAQELCAVAAVGSA